MKQFSQYQEDIFSAATNLSNHLLIQATAGSGKTTTLVELANRMTPLPQFEGKRFIFMAFNKSIAEELAKRLPKTVTVKTLHSHGMSVLRQCVTPNLKLDDWKYANIVQELMKTKYGIERGQEEYFPLHSATTSLLNFCQSNLIKPTDTDGMRKMVLKYELSIEFDQMTRVFTMVKEAMIIGRDQIRQGLIGYIDMVWGPWCLNLKPEPYDVMMVDESQDLSPVQLDLVKRSLAKDGKFIAVGDRSQSVYSFTGADSASMDKIKEAFNCLELPLSICYRCPQSHIELARQLDPSIEARPGAPKGEIAQISEDEMLSMVGTGDMIISRVNAPLVPLCFSLIRRGINAHIRGQDIGKDLARTVEKIFEKVDRLDVKNFYPLMNQYGEKQRETLKAKFEERPEKLETVLSNLDDRLAVIEAIFESTSPRDVKEFSKNIKSLFSDKNSQVTLSSVHRAKGLEADRVFIASPERLPLPFVKSPEGLLSERNLEFVALTRSRQSLFFLGQYHRFIPTEEAVIA